MFCRHVVLIDVECTEDWSALRARNHVLLLDFFAVLLLPVWIFRQLSQLVSELMTINLLDWV